MISGGSRVKKFIMLSCALLCMLFCSCTADTSGYVSELTGSSWSAKLSGGARAELFFKDGAASLNIESGGKSVRISGKYIADEDTLVIFMPEIDENYAFSYVPKGNKLSLSYGGNSIILEKTKAEK